jgi:long-subunit fatty acid transport protein
MWSVRRLGACVAVLISAGFSTPALQAQGDGEYFGIFQFRLQNPGARARGLGGAFVALADDASASFINPAGLAYLDRWEVGVEYEHSEVKGKAAQNSGTTANPFRSSYSFKSDKVNAASVVFPIKKGRVSGAVFYADLSPLDRKKSASVGIPGLSTATKKFFDAGTAVGAKNAVAGASIGFRLSDRVSIGAALGRSKLEFAGAAVRGGRYLCAPDVDPNYICDQVNVETSYASDKDTFATVGVLLSPSHKWNVGFSWQKQSEYELVSNAYGYEDVYYGPYLLGRNQLVPVSFSSKFTIPTRWALGFAFKPNDRLTISSELDRIEYSDVFKGFDSQTFFDRTNPDYKFTARNVTELHLGVEYSVFLRNVAWSFRGGYWSDPDHSPYFAGTAQELRDRQPKRTETVHHFTAGVGFSLQHLMFDLAADHSADSGDSGTASVVFRF